MSEKTQPKKWLKHAQNEGFSDVTHIDLSSISENESAIDQVAGIIF